ncbi:hypothetical protein RCL_jg14766.t3 [Rhizophagus clarus]|uniref:Uncharacterized protein n=1 Tax=Rhizophagus clarus TaxID=94130 RepID=A0A8H3QYJ9_9GLOM|nr:hypothetical protein RCL_jg14766.t3 [Rhizophagus clarus]
MQDFDMKRLSDLFEHDVSVNSVKNGLYKRVFAIKKKLKLSRAPYSSDEKGFVSIWNAGNSELSSGVSIGELTIIFGIYIPPHWQT